MKAFFTKILAALVLALVAFNASAVYIYNNSVNDQTNRLSAVDNVWFGDEVVLSTTYTSERFMTGFDFQVWAENTDGLTVDIELRLNDGALSTSGYATPGTLVYQYLGFILTTDTARSTININAADLDAFDGIYDGGTVLNLDNLTLTLNFHLDSGETAGVDLYNPVVEGSSFLDYWQYNGSNWELTTNNVFGTVNFGMTIQASVPEPSVFSIFIMGGLMAFGFRRFFGKK